MGKRYFGTDGIRGRVGEPPITADFVMKMGWAMGKVLTGPKEEDNKFLIGKDTRISGYMFESALQAGFIAAGAAPGLLGPMPTPAVSYLTRTFNACAGIVISASHNTHEDNGIKVFDSEGYKLSDALEQRIEAQLQQDFFTSPSQCLGKAFRVSDSVGRYVEYCKGTASRNFSLRGKTIVVDCANGATYQVAPKVFSELGAKVIPIATDPNGLNINLDCGSTKPNLLQATLLSKNADLGIAFDGDGDRVIFADHKGELVDGDELLFILSEYLNQHNQLKGVVGTAMTNYGLEKAFNERNIPFFRANVGDRYVIEAMRDKGWNLGGENSGHIICGDICTTGDAIIAALQVLQALDYLGSNLHVAKKGFSKLSQVMINVDVKDNKQLENNSILAKALKYTKKQLNGEGRVLMRPSGTEPVIRIMVETSHPKLASTLAEELAKTVQEQLGYEPI